MIDRPDQTTKRAWCWYCNARDIDHCRGGDEQGRCRIDDNPVTHAPPDQTTLGPQDMRLVHNGVTYASGTAGSLLLSCQTCGTDRFRDPVQYFQHPPEWEACFKCHTPMEPVRRDEIATKWKPIWDRFDGVKELP